MSAKQISQWRTFLFGVVVLGMLAAVLVVIVTRSVAPDQQVVALFSSLCTTAWIAILGLASKSGVEHLAGGGGAKGAIAALLTDAKPGDKPPPSAGCVRLGLVTVLALASLLVVACATPGGTAEAVARPARTECDRAWMEGYQARLRCEAHERELLDAVVKSDGPAVAEAWRHLASCKERP